jgi:hypothetical protein
MFWNNIGYRIYDVTKKLLDLGSGDSSIRTGTFNIFNNKKVTKSDGSLSGPIKEVF